MTEIVIRSIHRNTHPDSFRLVVLDNGSEQSTRDMLKDMHENGLIDELIQLDENMGLEFARDYMLYKATQSEQFVCLDNDCIPQPMVNGQDWLQKLHELNQKYEDFAAISLRTQVMVGTGNIFEEADEVGDDIVEFPHPGGSFRIMPTKLIQDIGGWDSRREGRGAEERYICGKLRDVGFRCAFATDIHCLHLFGTRGSNETDRWGYDPSFKPEDTGHSDISHPALTNGDDLDDVTMYAGYDNAVKYFK